jgi:hypothetical protein
VDLGTGQMIVALPEGLLQPAEASDGASDEAPDEA